MAVIAATVVGRALSYPAWAGEKLPKEHVVEIRDLKFVPDTLRVRPGDTIKWINRDIAPHTATAKDKSWDTGLIKKDGTKSLLVTPDLILDYYCRFHPAMTARLAIALTE